MSGNGKTSFVMQLVKYLCGFQKVLYESLEEGDKLTFQTAVKRVGMESVKSNFQYQSDTYPEMVERLKAKRSANIVVIDSLQYLRVNSADYKNLLRWFPNKLFIFISHAKGNEPKGNLGTDVMYGSDVKIRVHHFVATPIETTRYGGDTPYIIWEEGYRKKEMLLT